MNRIKSKQVLDVQQMQHLQELGLNLKPSLLHYYKIINIDSGKWYLSVTIGDISHDSPTYQYIPAYTLADIIETLPSNIEDTLFYYWLEMGKENEPGTIDEYTVEYRTNSGDTLYRVRKTGNLIDAAYETLCWCLENKYIETNEK